MKEDKRSAKELVEFLRTERGLSVTELAHELQRDRRMISKIQRGETSGAAYRQTLIELATRGQAIHRPPRRRNKAGQLVRVRGKDGETHVPEETGGRYVTQPKRGKFESSSAYMQGGGRQYRIAMPKTKGAKGREQAVAEVQRLARQMAQSQRWGRRRVKFQITYANGRTQEIGAKAGYQASDFLAQVNMHDGDAISWLLTQSAGRYADLDTKKTPITGITMTGWAAVDEEPPYEY